MKLYYFDVAGRAEPIKLLLTHAHIPFEDIRISFAEWPKYKEQFELKQVPVLEVEGKRYCQSIAILEFLGAKYGYLPLKSFQKMYKVMFVMNTTDDLLAKVFSGISEMSPLDEKAKAEIMDKLYKVDGPMFIGAVEKIFKQNSNKNFIVGKKYTIADFYLLGSYRILTTDEQFKKELYPKFVEKHPELYAYLEKRLKDFNPFYKLCKTKLYYFDAPGRAEMIRMVLKYLKFDYEDVRIKESDWPKEKVSGKFELQQVPAIICEPCAAHLSQTDAIMHKIGARFGLLPTNPEKLYKVIWWCNTAKDIMEGCFKVELPIAPEKKKEIMDKFFKESVPTFLHAMEERLKSNKCQCCLVGRKYTIADFYVMGAWRSCINNVKEYKEFQEIIPKYPVLKEYCESKDKIF